MRILVSSDWQAEAETNSLPICWQVVEEIIELKEKYGFETFVHGGDVKRAYNPVDIRVVNFIQKAIVRFREAGLQVVACLGNHDRRSLYADKESWFPVLRRAGAKTFDTPGVVRLGGGYEIRVLPFRSNPVLLEREAMDLAVDADKKKSVLIFHTDLYACRYNVLSRSEASFRAESLSPEKYLYCIGGHIHLQQNVTGNVWYAGSPFCTDWGEANQPKGYLLVDFTSGQIKQIPSKIPGWYDPSWPGFEEVKPKTWKGTRVRIKVRCDDTKDIKRTLADAKEKAEGTYSGADVVVIPTFDEANKRSAGIRTDWPDRKKLESFAKTTLPDELKAHKEKVITYLAEQLEQAGGPGGEQGELRIEKIVAANFLPFKGLRYVVEPGLCVVSGINKDWNRSNGSGKTSFLQPLAVAVGGKTFKGQKHDKWMRRGTGKREECFVRVWAKNGKGKSIIVTRARQPKELRLSINGIGMESGNRPETTQKLIEQSIGYTWETLANVIYVDQARTHLMLTGKDDERRQFLAKLQRLERFEVARKQVKKQKGDLDDRLQSVQMEIATAQAEARNIDLTISQMREILAPEANLTGRYARYKEKYELANEQLVGWTELARQRLKNIDAKIELEQETLTGLGQRFAVLEERLILSAGRIHKLKKLEGKCQTCLQPIKKDHIAECVKGEWLQTTAWKTDRNRIRNEVEVGDSLIAELREKKKRWRENSELEVVVSDLREKLSKLQYEKEQFEKQQTLVKKLRERKAETLEKKEELEKREKKLTSWMRVLDYAQMVFAKDGLPAFINAQLCPQLNQAAEKYAELFAQKEIQVRFAMDENGEMDVQVINTHGGEGVLDQSEGEMKIASLITSFAVRAIAPKTNLLILDEPGDGLDPISARQFAKGLKEIAGEFGTVLLKIGRAHV